MQTILPSYIRAMWLTPTMHDHGRKILEPKQEAAVVEKTPTGYVLSWYEKRTGEAEWRRCVRHVGVHSQP